MKRLAITIALICVVAGSALAGDIPCGDFVPPPPPPPPPLTATAPSFGETPAAPSDIQSAGFAQPTISDEVIANVLGILRAGFLRIY